MDVSCKNLSEKVGKINEETQDKEFLFELTVVLGLVKFTRSCIMLKNGQRYFKNTLRCEHWKILKVCLAILQHHA